MINEERYVAFNMKDNSMTPEIQEGDIIIVDVTAPVQNGDLVVAQLEDGRTVLRKMQVLKKEEEYIFSPINAGKYDPIFSTNPLIIGRAVRLCRNIHNKPFKTEESNIAGQVPLFDARPAIAQEGGKND